MPASTSAPVTSALAALVAQGSLKPDPLQAGAARVLDVIAEGLGENGLFRRRPPVRGAYLVGAVGRGKTMLMDVFFAAAPPQHKRRAHFDAFMDEVHAAITQFRRDNKGDPVAAVVQTILKDTRLLCLDEFQVDDITNAMLLGRLFERLFEGGVTLVATSNTPPDDLYQNGLNRDLVLPFIADLKAHVDVVRLDGPTDYRRLKLGGEQVFRFGVGPDVAAGMNRLWERLTGGVPPQPETVRSLGRDIVVPQAAMGAARFPFAALCEAPLGARDYLRLAQRYDAIVVDGVPQFDRTKLSAAKRFVLLIDTLYDRHLTLGASFAVGLDDLAGDSPVGGELARTTSRLTEMQSTAYLQSARAVAGDTKG